MNINYYVKKFSSNKTIFFSYVVLVIFSFVSIFKGVENALKYSQDFQWSPSVLFWRHINPYEHYLNGGDLILSQAPNYLQLLYIILKPFTIMNWEQAKLIWALSNMIMGFGSLFLLYKYYNCTSIKKILFISTIFLTSTPFRNSIGNGQHSLLILFLTLFFWRLVTEKKNSFNLLGATAFTISLVKYSFALPFTVALLFEKKFFYIIFSIIIHLVAILFFAFHVNSNPITLSIEPYLVAKKAVSLNMTDFYSQIKFYFPSTSVLMVTGSVILLTLFTVNTIYKINENRITPPIDCQTTLRKLALISLISLTLFPHLQYDFVFLLPSLAYAVTANIKLLTKIAISICIFWFFYGLKIINFFYQNFEYLRFINPCLLILTFIVIVKESGRVKWI